MKIAKCQLCEANVIWVEHHKTSKPAPIDVEPSTDGNILVTGDLYEVVPKAERERVIKRGRILRKNHFATCPFAGKFRGPKDQEKSAA